MLNAARSTAKARHSFESRERVRALFARFDRSKDASIRDELVMLHLGLVRSIAGRFANRGEPLEDLVQVGVLGLINAIDRFDCRRGVEFTTYAMPTIVGEIRRHFRDKGWAMRVPRRLKELHLAVSRATESLSIRYGRSATIAELASHLGATDEEIIEAQELSHVYSLVSLDAVTAPSDEHPLPLSAGLGCEDEGIKHTVEYADLRQACTMLDVRERSIVNLRFFQNLPQSAVGKKLGLSQMHVSRLQHRAVEKMRRFLNASEGEPYAGEHPQP